MDEVRRFVGIDVAKAALDVFMGSAGTAFTVSNDEGRHQGFSQTARDG